MKREGSMKALKSDVRSMLVAALVITVLGGTAAAAVVADFAKNAGKVDGKDAVGSGASNAQAKGRLVATAGNGKFAPKFLPKVPTATQADHAVTAGDASTVGGFSPGDLVIGGGSVHHQALTLNPSISQALPEIPGFGTFTFICSSQPSVMWTGSNSSIGTWMWMDAGDANPTAVQIDAPFGSAQVGPIDFANPADRHEWVFENPAATATITTRKDPGALGAPAVCQLEVSVVVY
jgi:hypothetical protein